MMLEKVPTISERQNYDVGIGCVSRENAEVYAEGVRRGAALVSVRTTEAGAPAITARTAGISPTDLDSLKPGDAASVLDIELNL